jgi:hypothetical protein
MDEFERVFVPDDLEDLDDVLYYVNHPIKSKITLDDVHELFGEIEDIRMEARLIHDDMLTIRIGQLEWTMAFLSRLWFRTFNKRKWRPASGDLDVIERIYDARLAAWTDLLWERYWLWSVS